LKVNQKVCVYWWDHSSPENYSDLDNPELVLTVTPGWLRVWEPEGDMPHLVIGQAYFPSEETYATLTAIGLPLVQKITTWGRKILWQPS